MFGHQNDVITQDQKQDADVALPDSAVQALTSDPVITPPTDNPSPVQSPPAITLDETAETPVDEPQVVSASSTGGSMPMDPDFTAPASFASISAARSSRVDSSSQDTTPPEPDTPSSTSSPSTVTIHSDDLLDIKNEALHDLSPLVDQLDLSAEEKFKTVMMLIQASDNQDLIPQAYTLAKQIDDEKVKAQALLDVVNEINYFTQKDSDKE